MTRKEFIRLCGILGVGLPFQLPLISCTKENGPGEPFSGKVIIIGAGAGGLSAGYLLHQLGVDFEILEASEQFGGRMKIHSDFADFPIPLGAEWLETTPDIFQTIVNNPSVQVQINTIEDEPDYKFVHSSWYNFYTEYIVPSIAGKIVYNTVVQSVDYSGEQILIQTPTGTYTADRAIVSVPLKILQDGDMKFIPVLPQKKSAAIQNTVIWEGFKAFFAFKTAFYADEYVFPVTPSNAGEKIYYNATLGQNSSQYILGLFTVGEPAQAYITRSGDELRDYILQELDDLYAGQATPNYLKHIAQNWQDEPFIRSGYMSDHADWQTVRELGMSVNKKLFFAGGEYTNGDDWVSVHTAALSARRAIEELHA